MHIPELTHNIMKYLDYESLKGFRQVSKSYQHLVDESAELQIVLFNKSWTSGSIGFDRWVKHNSIESHDAEENTKPMSSTITGEWSVGLQIALNAMP